MQPLRIGDVSITSIVERDGPWRRPAEMFPAYDEAVFRHHLAGMEPEVTVERVEDEAKLRLARAAQATEIPGVDLTKMTPEKRTAAIKAMNAENCTCGCQLTLAECRINDPACEISLPLAKALAEKIAAGN